MKRVACNLNLKPGAYENQKKPAVVLNQFMKSAWIVFLRMLVPGLNMLYHFCPQIVLRYNIWVTSLNPCLMQRCVCIWWDIVQNYNYKLHFQNLSIYHIPHISIGAGPWPLKILMFALLVTHEIATYNWPWERPEMANICWVCCLYWYQNLGGAPPRGQAFLS